MFLMSLRGLALSTTRSAHLPGWSVPTWSAACKKRDGVLVYHCPGLSFRILSK